MGTLYFLLLVVLVAVAAYLVMRSSSRARLSFAELMSRTIPPPKEPVIPGTWGAYKELNRQRKNSAVFTEAADRYRRVMAACTDEESVWQMRLTHRTYLSNHAKLTWAIVRAFVCICFVKLAKDRLRSCIENVASYYANEVLLLEEMSEVMDKSCVAVLEGQFLHGT